MDEIVNGLKERLSNSFAGPFALFFGLHNWQIFIFSLTGDEDASARIANVAQFIKEQGTNLWSQPLVWAILYIFLVPIFVAVIDLYKAFKDSVTANMIEKIRLKRDKTMQHKFEAAQQLASKMQLTLNIRKSRQLQAQEIDSLQKYVAGILETENKSILEHLSGI